MLIKVDEIYMVEKFDKSYEFLKFVVKIEIWLIDIKEALRWNDGYIRIDKIKNDY